MKRDEVRRVARDAFDQLVRDIEAGKSDTLQAYLKAMGRFHCYSVGNAMLIQLQRTGATHVAGFRAWQRLGRHVKKGEHGIAIMAPVVYRKKTATNDKDVNTASSDYIQLYDGDREILMRSLERIQRTAAEILEAVAVDDGQRVRAGDGPTGGAVAA